MDPSGIIIAPVLFLIVVAPIWIIMHYRAKGRSHAALTEDERAELERLSSAAVGMRERIENLESILDAETPEWRRRDGATARRSGVGHDQD